jgi:DNA-binding NarL/FixJ family response regulator
MSGEWEAAAVRWSELNCPYEAARALGESDDAHAMRWALDEFDRLGAAPARAEVAQRLRELGVASIPRGARPSTRANPAGLTNRQVDVARLIAGGLSNAEIAERLFISPKTVEHHVSAIFAKLEVDNRLDAARSLERLGLLPEE